MPTSPRTDTRHWLRHRGSRSCWACFQPEAANGAGTVRVDILRANGATSEDLDAQVARRTWSSLRRDGWLPIPEPEADRLGMDYGTFLSLVIS